MEWFRAKWKGVDVAVKRFIKQKLDEETMLEFCAEIALLAELHHPNIILYISTKAIIPCFWVCWH
jgi:serine/threonine protein kinase